MQKLFDNDPWQSLSVLAFVVTHAQLVALQHEVNRFMGLGSSHGHHHTLACGQTIGFHHNRCAFGVDIVVCGLRVGERFVIRCGNVVALHERLAKGLRAFELRRGLGGAKNAQAMGAELIHHPRGQGSLRADHGQLHRVGLRKLAQRDDIRDVDVVQALVARCAAVARGDKDFLHLVGLGNLPRQSVLAATAANNKYVHSAAL